MNIKTIILVLSLPLLLLTCKSKAALEPSDKILLEILGEFSNTIKMEGFFLAGFGGGIDHESKLVNKIIIPVATDGHFTLEEGRVILIKFFDELISLIDTREDFKIYLCECPPTEKLVTFSIVCRDKDFHTFPFLHSIGVHGGILDYTERAPDGKGLITIHTETYEEAKQILSSQTQE